MWLEIRRSSLGERDRERVAAALAAPPILSDDRGAPDREGAATALCLAVLLLFLAAQPTPHASAYLALGTLAMATFARRACSIARSAKRHWPRGRYLFPWGYAEVEADVLYLRRGEDLDVSIVREGPWPIAVRCAPRGGLGRATELPLPRRDERAIPHGALAALRSARFGEERAGYRGVGDLPPGRALAFRVPDLAVDALVAAAVLGAGALAVGGWREPPRIAASAPKEHRTEKPRAPLEAAGTPAEPMEEVAWPPRLRCELCERWPPDPRAAVPPDPRGRPERPARER